MALPALTGGERHDRTRDDHPAQETEDVEQEALVEDALVEEISIDGMCGVY